MKIFVIIFFSTLALYVQAQTDLSKSAKTAASLSSIFSLRQLGAASAQDLYFITEQGKEGCFRLDAADHTSSDNEGTVVVTRLGKRYKRVFAGEVNVAWFGAKGDGISNDTEAFNKALTAKSNCLYIPYSEAGYRIANVSINKTFTIKGDNKFNSKILPALPTTSCFITQAEFVEYRDLYFEGNGVANCVGIEHRHKISTVSNCFFSGLDKGIFNSKIFVAGAKPNEQTISNCRFRNCMYGVFSDGYFINSRIINSIFHTCTSSAIFCDDGSYNESVSATEGLTIEGCLIYDSGSSLQNIAAIELVNVDFTFIRNCMLDLNTYTALHLTNAQNCNISGTYFSSAASINGSGVTLSGNCSNTNFESCQFYDNKEWGCKISGFANRNSDNVRLNNCSARLNKSGDMSVNGGTNIWINNSNFYSNSTKDIQADNTLGNTTVYIRSTNITGGIEKEHAAVRLDLKDCPTQPTTKLGTISISDGKQSVTFPHGLTVLEGQKIIIVANCEIASEPIYTKVDHENITLFRSGNKGEVQINFRAEVQ